MKIHKKIVGYLAIVALGLGVFFPSQIGGNITNAAGEQTSSTSTTKTEEDKTIEKALFELWTLVDIALKLLYLVLWPMMFLAGIALDNSMVYGSFFHMDAPLWSFWNMTKNFANFGLGFIVLFSILKGIFSNFGGKKDNWSPMEIIKKTLIAGVLIQSSWFIMAVLIDISTIATYAVGGMPLTLLNAGDIKGTDRKILQTESVLELNNITKTQQEDFRVRYKTKVLNGNTENVIEISPCEVKTLGQDTYIIGRKYGETKFKNTTIDSQISESKIKIETETNRNICIFGNKPYFFKEFPNTINATEAGGTGSYSAIVLQNIEVDKRFIPIFEQCRFIVNLEESKQKNNTCNPDTIYNTKLGELTNKEDKDQLTAWRTTFNKGIANPTVTEYGSTPGSGRLANENILAPTVSMLIDKSKGFVGPFVTIYASIMDFANLSDSDGNNSSSAKNLGNMIIRAAVAIGLVTPLIALALVLFIRIGLLRVVIATTPIIILVHVFKDVIKIDLGEHFKLENIFQAIFAPVITVFALSISVIFMTTLSNSLTTDNIDKINVLGAFGASMQPGGPDGTDVENTHLNILGYTIIYPKITDTYAGAAGDRFSWMLISFCGIGIMRFLLFAAIKATGTIGKVAETIKSFGENVIKTAPIIPIGGGVTASFGGLKESFYDNNSLEQIRNKKVNFEGQKEELEEFAGDKIAMAKHDFGNDQTFSNKEKGTVTNVLNSNNSNQVIETLKERGFIDRNLDEKGSLTRIQDLYTSDKSNFKDIIDNSSANEETRIKLLGENYKKDKAISELKAEVGEKFKEITELKTKLENEKIKKLLKKASDEKLISEKETITNVEIGEGKEKKTYEIQYIDGKLIETEKKEEAKVK